MSATTAARTAPPPQCRSGSDEAPRGAPLAISNQMVRLYKRAFGKGPTRARTQFAGRDTVVIVLEDVLTVAERTLLGLGRDELLRPCRQVIQEALEAAVRELVEDALGRRTRAFIAGIDLDRATVVNVLTLEPAAGPGEPSGDSPWPGREGR